MVELLRSRCHFLLLLVPSFSFDKEVNFPENATLEQRIEMMVSVYEKEGNQLDLVLSTSAPDNL